MLEAKDKIALMEATTDSAELTTLAADLVELNETALNGLCTVKGVNTEDASLLGDTIVGIFKTIASLIGLYVVIKLYKRFWPKNKGEKEDAL